MGNSKSVFNRVVLAPVECGGGGKLNDFSIKPETFVFTNSKSPKIFRRSVEMSENLMFSKNWEDHAFLPRCPCYLSISKDIRWAIGVLRAHVINVLGSNIFSKARGRLFI